MWVALTRAICRIQRLRKKMKESQDHMAELDKHLYVALGRGWDLRDNFANGIMCREEYAKSQGGEQN